MKNFSRKVSLVLIALLAVTMAFTACNRNGDDEVRDTVVADTGAVADTGTAEDPQEEVQNISGIHAPIDMGGRTLRAASGWGNPMPFNPQEAHDEPDPSTSTDYHRDRLIWDNAQRVRDEFNFVLEGVHVMDDFMGMLTASILAGDPIGDLVFLEGGGLLSAANGELIMPWGVTNVPGSDIFGGPNHYGRVNTSFFGEDWAIYYNMPSPHVWMMGVNMDIINTIGAPSPIDLHNNGQWTWDAALNIMRMATRDTTGDGMFDQWGLSGQVEVLARHILASNDAPTVDDDFNYALDHPNTIEALEFLQTIFLEGLWQYDVGAGFDPWDWGRNHYALLEGNSVFFGAILWGLGGGDLPFELAVVPWPTGPSNTAGYTWWGSFGGGLTLPFGSEWDPNHKLIIVEEFLAWPGDEVELMFEGGLNWPRQVLHSEEDVQRWFASSLTPRLDLGSLVPGYYHVLGAMVHQMYLQEMTIQQMIEHHRPERQAMLDDFFR